jgi:hypothetical protein
LAGPRSPGPGPISPMCTPRSVPGASEADRWVATTAVWLQVPLVADDQIFANVKDLELLTRLLSQVLARWRFFRA